MERSTPLRLRPTREEDPAALRELFLRRRTGGMAGTAPGISRTPGRPSGGTASRWRSGKSPAYGSARRRPGPSGRRRRRRPGGGRGFCGNAFLRESRRFRQPARKPDRRADIGAGSGMRDPAREQTAGFPCAPLPHPAEQGAAAENGRGTERRKAVPSQGRRQEYKPRFLLAAFGAPSELEREKLPGRQHEGLGIAAMGARITTASPRKRMGRNAKRSAPGRGPGKFPLPPGRKLTGSPAPSNRG